MKATQMNMQHSLIWELMFYKLELGHNAAEAIKNICYAKSEGKVDHSTLIWWFKKFPSDCKKLTDQARSGRPKTVDSKVILQVIEYHVSLTSRSSLWFIIFMTSVKISEAASFCLMLPKYCLTIDLPKYLTIHTCNNLRLLCLMKSKNELNIFINVLEQHWSTDFESKLPTWKMKKAVLLLS